MTILLLAAIGILGIIVGSFLNVVIYRYNTGKGIGGRSMCMACRKTLSWYELVPVVSFLLQVGRCRSCGAKLSWQYMSVELLTGLGFVLVSYKYVESLVINPWHAIALLFGFILVSLFIVITVYDIRHMIMPDAFVFAFIGLAGLSLFFPILTGGVAVFALPALGQVLAGLWVPLPFLILWAISKGRWIGFGDIKFMIGIGWLLGLSQGATAVIFAFWIGTLWVVCVYLFSIIMKFLSTRRLVATRLHRIIGKEIPFAPFLILATFIVFISHIDLIILLTSF